ncbi:Arm DNA-binding domain-containing protein [Methylophaga sp. OBS3]|nr:Arm DNA-binding domain-containing protein [Methylophaga sp. OBS3]
MKANNAKPGIKPDGTATDKRYKLTDEKGLYLEVAPGGGKWWRFKYRFDLKLLWIKFVAHFHLSYCHI